MPASESDFLFVEEVDMGWPVRDAVPGEPRKASIAADESVFCLKSLVPIWNGNLPLSDCDVTLCNLFTAANQAAGYTPKIVIGGVPCSVAGFSDPFKLRVQMRNRLSVLELSNANIGPGGAAILAEHLKSANGKCMTEVRLDCNALGDNGARAICQAITKDHHVTVVSMEMNGITKDSCSEIGRLVSRMPTISKLFLGNNPLGDEGVSRIAEILHESTAMNELGLSATDMTSASARAIADGLLNSNSLTHIMLNRNSLMDEGVASLAATLETRSTLRCLELADVKMTAKGCKRLAEAVLKSSLTRVVFGPNPLFDEGAMAVAKLLRHSSTLISVELDQCGITDKGANAIHDALDANDDSRIRSVQLHQNTISPVMALQLKSLGEERSMRFALSSLYKYSEGKLRTSASSTPPPSKPVTPSTTTSQASGVSFQKALDGQRAASARAKSQGSPLLKSPTTPAPRHHVQKRETAECACALM